MNDQSGFYNHTLHFATLEQANIAECMILPKFKGQMDLLGHEVNEDDGPCLKFQTREPLDEHRRLLINRDLTFGVIASYNIPFTISYEQWRNEPPEHTTEIKREDGTTLMFVDDQTNGRYIALFDQDGKNLQHISFDNAETEQLKSWVNGLGLPENTDDQYFTPCDECGQPAPVQSTQEGGDLDWTRYSYICTCGHSEADISFNPNPRSEEERIEARAQHWLERQASEADYIQRPW